MRRRSGKQQDRDRRIRATHVFAMAAALALHLALGMMLMQPAIPRHPVTARRGGHADTLRVRWIHASEHAAAATPSRQKDVTPPGPLRPVAETHTTTPSAARTPARPETSAQTPSSPALDLAVPSRGPVRPGYVSGGGAFDATPSSTPMARLPGQDAVAHAPVFRMIDPRSQGIAGVVHLIGSLTGAVDPRCIDLDQWRALSRRERATRGITERSMAAVARQHGCVPPPERIGPGVRPAPTR